MSNLFLLPPLRFFRIVLKSFLFILFLLHLSCSSSPIAKVTEFVAETSPSEKEKLFTEFEKSAYDVGLSLVSIKLDPHFCDKFESKKINPLQQYAELDLRIWLKEKNSNIAHIATNEGFGIIRVPCKTDKPEFTRYSLFFNNQVFVRDEFLQLGVKIYETDVIFDDSKRRKISKFMQDLEGIASTAIDKGLVSKTTGDKYLEKMQILLLPVELLNDIYEFFAGPEELVTSFHVNFNKKNFFSPVSTDLEPDQIQVYKHLELNSKTNQYGYTGYALSRKFRVSASGITLLFDATFTKVKE